MKLLIEIPESQYRTLNAKSQSDVVTAIDDALLIKAIKNGISLPKGHWTKEESTSGWDGRSYQCSACGRSIHLDTKLEDLRDYPYCHCGAKMEGESE